MNELSFPIPGPEPLLPGVPDQPEAAAARSEAQRKAIEAAGKQLRGRAFLHDDPDAYAAGVRDALSEVDEQLGRRVVPPLSNPEQ